MTEQEVRDFNPGTYPMISIAYLNFLDAQRLCQAWVPSIFTTAFFISF
jgi:hypothetical protein